MYERGSPWAAYGAAIWALIFAVFHIVWAAGWYPLLNAEQARIAFAVQSHGRWRRTIPRTRRSSS